MMTQQLAQSDPRQLAQASDAAPMQRLDPYAKDGIAAQAGRLAPLAIISLGFRQTPKREGELGLPRATRRDDERWLHLHDADQRAPGLAEALERGAHRHLTIAFPIDDPRAFIQQTFVRWSASALEIYGDANGLNVIDTRNGPEHKFVPPNHPDFARLVRTCKADTRLYFALAEWMPSSISGDPQSRVLFPDGFGWYCFRTTGRHTAAEIIGYLENFRTFTRGRLAGIPFDLTVVFREVAGPDGKKRTVPVANVVARPPEQQVLDSQTFRVLASAGLEQGRNLQLPALPSPEELALQGPPDLEDDLPEDAVRRLAAGDFPCDYNVVVRTWHAIVRGTPLENDENRAVWLRQWSQGDFESLTAVRQLTQREATQMLADLADGVSDVREEIERVRAEEAQAANLAAYNRTLGAADWGEPRSAGSGLEESTTEKGEAQQQNTRQERKRRVGESNASTSSPDPAPEATAHESELVNDYGHPLWEEWKRVVKLAHARQIEVPAMDVGNGQTVGSLRAAIASLLEAVDDATGPQQGGFA
jgi:hypothetical protein